MCLSEFHESAFAILNKENKKNTELTKNFNCF